MSAQPPPNDAKPLRSAMKSEDDVDKTPPTSCSLKAVQIAEPVPEEAQLDDEPQLVKQFRAGSVRRLSGSPAVRPMDESAASSSHQRSMRQYYSEKLLAQVGDWLDRERKKKAAGGKKKKTTVRRKSRSPPDGQVPGQDESAQTGRKRSDSIDSESSDVSLDRLQRILEDSMASFGLNSIPDYASRFTHPRRRRSNSRPSMYRAASSDTDYADGDVIVPSCDAWLDNSKTLSYTGGAAATPEDATPACGSSRLEKDREAWATFKNEIIRITHTLKLKGWRRIPLGSGHRIAVERLSGALTNAVYVVHPPSDLAYADGRPPPPKVLLRVYGPQVEHLIDRETELKVLQRLARKKIGPRLLGTFQNGRFEQFFNAITLTPSDLREPETSRQIAKRMRELHQGVEVLQHERDAGPGVFKNWDQWHENVARITSSLDTLYERSVRGELPANFKPQAWMANGYVAGVPWPMFRDTMVKYREHLVTVYKTQQSMNDRMIFAHNDTQYGNILRVRPDDEKSPLLQPANKHKQLVVIDFEYASANVAGYDFANHFIEWTYNYHDPVLSWACNARRYPCVEEQRRFIKAYVDHRPQFPFANSTPRLMPLDSSPASSTATPGLVPTPSSSSIVDFMLDARVPPGGWSAAERAREEQSDQQVREYMEEARLWRPACSGFWVQWGIVQARIPEMPDGASEDAAEEEQEEFDYLLYAQDRVYLFWGDCVQLGLVKLEDLPESLREKIKIVEC